MHGINVQSRQKRNNKSGRKKTLYHREQECNKVQPNAKRKRKIIIVKSREKKNYRKVVNKMGLVCIVICSIHTNPHSA